MKRTAFPLSYFLFLISYSLFTSCKTTEQISKQATKTLITDTAISKGFIGISVFDPSTNKYLYNYNADKYFVPASNTKLFTLYAGMKYLGDSLVGMRVDTVSEYRNFLPTGDPTFLHPDFKIQPVLNFMIKEDKHPLFIMSNLKKIWKEKDWGYGWAWDDYNESFMTERSAMPIYGNIVRFSLINDSVHIRPSIFTSDFSNNNKYVSSKNDFHIERKFSRNYFYTTHSPADFINQEVPFYTDEIYTAVRILNAELYEYNYLLEAKQDSLKAKEAYQNHMDYISKIKSRKNPDSTKNVWSITGAFPFSFDIANYKKIHSQPSDSLFKPMMHNSDNFFAEQTLLMASNEHLGYMSDEDIIDTLLKLDLKDAPQKPKWVDGSGLSRYNLFTPQDFVYILNKMKNEFGMERMKTILATGGEGTIKNYFKKDAGFIYAKTGTLSNNCALSGYIITKKNKLVIFSILANNYQTGATPVRKAVEKFVEYIRDVY